MRSSVSGPVVAILGLAIWSGQARAEDDDAARRCAAISDDSSRLACYDGIFRGPGGAAPPGMAASGAAGAAAGAAAGPAGGAPAAATPVNPAADFGLTPARKESIEAAEAKASGAPVVPKVPAVPESITARVATVARRLKGELVVILDDGQIWLQIDSETKGRLKEGDEVTIRKATLGSYFLVTPNHILVRVRRVQ